MSYIITDQSNKNIFSEDNNILEKEKKEENEKYIYNNNNDNQILCQNNKKEIETKDNLNEKKEFNDNNIFENESIKNEQSTKDEEDLNELSISNEKENNDYENNEFIDLSFLDKSFSNEINTSENLNEYGNNNMNNSYYYPLNNNILNNNYQRINQDNNCFQYPNMNNPQIYNMISLNNLYKNYNYNIQLLYAQKLNNIMQNYQNQNFISNLPFVPNNLLIYNNLNKKELFNKGDLCKQKKQIDKKYVINLLDIKTDKEKRTTVRMMNIPSYFRPLDLAKKIDEKFGIRPERQNRIYDFIYIPLSNNKKRENINAGYAFINFVSPKHILKFYSYFNGKKLKLKTSEKVCTITFASRQGTNIKYKGINESNNNKYMTFNDTKNHAELLVD